MLKAYCSPVSNIKLTVKLICFSSLLIASTHTIDAQSSTKKNLDDIDFEAISIRPEGNQNVSGMGISFQQDTFRGKAVTISQLVQYAYKLPDYLIDWKHINPDETFYEVRAKITESLTSRLARLPEEDRYRIRRMLVQKLLKERFGLETHEEIESKPGYSLSTSKAGVKLSPASEPRVYEIDQLQTAKAQVRFQGPGFLRAEALTLRDFAEFLSEELAAPVIDKTNLKGSFEFSLKWNSETNGMLSSIVPPSISERHTLRLQKEGNGGPPGEEAPSLTTALKEQLGLILQRGKSEIPCLVIDKIHAPTEN